MRAVRYAAAGGVVTDGEQVLVLRRPSRGEVRLPKGHVEKGESLEEAALREATEETGYTGFEIVSSLGKQVVEFNLENEHVVRDEYYFWMRLAGPEEAGLERTRAGAGEQQFVPAWLSWEQALAQLTFEAEREWLRRAWEAYRRTMGAAIDRE